MGANFKEGVFIADYTYKSWWFRAEAFIAHYGADSSVNVDYGRNIFRPLYLHTLENDASTGNGLNTKIYYGDLRIAYILNKKSNLRIEAGGVYRKESNAFKNFTDIYTYIGVRMSFRKLIYDF